MKDKILEVMEVARDSALNKEEIYRRCGYNDISFKDFLTIFKELEDDKKVYCVNSKDELYTLNPFKEGIFHIKRNGEFYVSCEGRDVIVKNNHFDLFDKDRVLVRITDFNTYEGSIKEIIERAGIIGEVVTFKGKKFAKVKEDLYKIDDDTLVDGMLVGIKIDKKKIGNYYRASIDRVIGHKNAPKILESSILYEYHFPVTFSDDAIASLKGIESLMSDDEIAKRRDLRDQMIFTIDGDDTKDIDDAVSLEIKDGYYYLGVHIADVSFFVKENGSLDLEARERGTSVYMPGVVSPMYPPLLSNGICSLNPLVDRFTISCMMKIDKSGEIVTTDIFKSIIHSSCQMTYKKVNSILVDNVVPEGYEKFEKKLREMNDLALLLRKNRTLKGMLNFDSSEVKITVSETGKVIDISKRVQSLGEELIEDFMLAANRSVAVYLQNLGVHSIYRIHDLPNIEKLKHVLTVITSYGTKIDVKIDEKDPKFIQKIIEALSNDKNFDVYSNMLLRCMAKASYTTNNIGHFGLGVKASRNEAYTHFTSPIRRYPDTTIHRILSDVLNSNVKRLYSEDFLIRLNDISMHSSEREVAADNCEREANKLKMASYMEDFIGKEFNGRVTGFTKNGMFVELDNYVEGRIDFSTMDDYYRYNEDLEVIVGDRSKKVYRLGDKVKVAVTRSDKEVGEIDFELVTKGVKRNGDFKQKSKI